MAGGIFILIFKKGGSIMKVRVLTAFRDRESDLVLRIRGETFVATKKRAESLIQRGFVEEVKGGDPKSPVET